MMTKTGTLAFSAPEIFTQKYYDEKIDVWSAGIVLYMMLSGVQPFLSDIVPELISMITRDEPNYNIEAFSLVSEDAKNFIKKMLTKDPKQRPSASECLSDPWFTEIENPFR